jgi:glycosyltransferase involved in cell wall biosynthesis
VKTFGIYLLYPPRVDLRAQGLGRYLAEFLKEARLRSDVNFVIACPSWMRGSVSDLFEQFGISPTAFEIIGPKERPVLLKLFDVYQRYQSYRRRKGISRLRNLLRTLRSSSGQLSARVERTLATTRNPLILALFFVLLLPVIIIGGLAVLVGRSIGSGIISSKMHTAWVRARARLVAFVRKTTGVPQNSRIVLRLYRFMEEAEANLVNEEVNSRKDIKAWYAPTAFWPQFNKIKAPRLICVPDVVLSEFPVGFASINEERFFSTFEAVEKTIKGGSHFVTYSATVKTHTLVERYQIAPDAITVVPHGANRLDHLITVSGFQNNSRAIDALCAQFFHFAVHKAIGTASPDRFHTAGIKFIFYASQFRPNKNVLTLLRAYDHLLKRKHFGYKLVLTGNPNIIPEIAQFIREHNLQNDVLCLHDLSDQELAACYRLADLAVNPSLSEGGCPFTLTEALSVGTPVLMSRIGVTEEIVTDPADRELMLFDPYKWKDIAERIEWALANSEPLLERQMALFQVLAKRSWRNVVDDYVSVLDRISGLSTSRSDAPYS